MGNNHSGYQDVTPSPSSVAFMWALMIIMAVSALIFLAHSFTKANHHREFHYIQTIITATACLAYLCMALNIGTAYIGGRTFLVQRYADWAITTPLLLIDLCLIARRSLATMFVVVALDELMIWSGALGEAIDGPIKWALFAFSMCCYIPVMWLLLDGFSREHSASTFGEKAAGKYHMLTGYLIFIWAFYPLAWILQRAGVIGVSGAVFFFGVLDIMAKPVFGAILLSLNMMRNHHGMMTKDGAMAGTAMGGHHHPHPHHHDNLHPHHTGAGGTVTSERDLEMSNPYSTHRAPGTISDHPTQGQRLEELKLAQA